MVRQWNLALKNLGDLDSNQMYVAENINCKPEYFLVFPLVRFNHDINDSMDVLTHDKLKTWSGPPYFSPNRFNLSLYSTKLSISSVNSNTNLLSSLQTTAADDWTSLNELSTNVQLNIIFWSYKCFFGFINGAMTAFVLPSRFETATKTSFFFLYLAYD